jgi:hypothetical protein
MDTSSQLERLVDDCVVSIDGPNIRGGSGFFVAAGMILTCAHVLSRRHGSEFRTVSQVTVRWRRESYAGRVESSQPASHDGKGPWRYPDLALIQLDDAPVSHSCVWLDDEPLSHANPLYASGYSQTYDKYEAGCGGATLEYVAPQTLGEHKLLKVKGDELAHGMSGGPVLNIWHGSVCAILKTARRENLPSGGLAIPVSAVREWFPKAWEANRRAQPHNKRWRALRGEARRRGASRELLIVAEAMALRALLQTLPVPDDLKATYRKVTGPLGPEPAGELLDWDDLIREVTDTMAGSDGLHPLLLLCEDPPEAADGPTRERLRQLGEQIASRLGQSTALQARRSATADPPPRRRSSSIMIQLLPSGANRRRYVVSVWIYHDIGALPVLSVCEDRPATLNEIRRSAKNLIPEMLHELGGETDDLLVEFSLPRGLLSEAVDEWRLSESWLRLGVQYPVVVRAVDRPVLGDSLWRRRWKRLRDHELDPPTMVGWVDCRDARSTAELHAWFQGPETRAILALSYQPDAASARSALEAALYAGVPIAIWRRRPCAHHARGHGPTADICQCDRFRASLNERLSTTRLDELPQLMQTLRAQAAEDPADQEHCGRDVTLLWDDPDRILGDEPLTSPAGRSTA